MRVHALQRFAESLPEEGARVSRPDKPVELIVRQDDLSFLVEDKDDIKDGADEAVEKRDLGQSSRLGQNFLA